MTVRRILISVLISAGPWVGNAQARVEQGPNEHDVVAGHGGETHGLRMNFRNVSLDTALDYLSASAGFIINKAADPKGTFDFWSENPLSKEEALRLMNSVLNKSGYALSSEERILTVTRLDSIKTTDLDVVSGNNPDAVNKSEQVITQIIPVHYANASQLANNLQLLLPTTATLSANESANALVLVASKTVIRRMLRIVKALDTSIATVTAIKVVPLRYADAKQLASVLQQFFSGQNSSTTMNMPGGFGPPGFGGPPGAFQDTGDTARPTAATKVVATADESSNSLIVSASAESLASIMAIVQQVDRPVSAATEMRIFKLQNADPSEIADQLTQLFPDSSKSSSSQNQQAPVFGPPGPGGGPAFIAGPFGPGGPPSFDPGNGSSTTGTRARTRGQVIAVPEPRTSSLLVSASSDLMPQIAKMIDELDASSARREVVKVFDLQNADPQDVNQILADLFNRNSSMRNNNNNNRSMLGQNNPLTQRAPQQQTGTSQASGFGNTGGQGGAGGAGGGEGTGAP